MGGGGGGGGGILRQIGLKLNQSSGRLRNPAQNQEFTDINLETRRYGSKSGDYRRQSGDREIRFKIWRLQTSIWRPGDTVQNLETPRLSGRVDSPEISKYIYNKLCK